jgi:hypothetical protein
VEILKLLTKKIKFFNNCYQDESGEYTAINNSWNSTIKSQKHPYLQYQAELRRDSPKKYKLIITAHLWETAVSCFVSEVCFLGKSYKPAIELTDILINQFEANNKMIHQLLTSYYRNGHFTAYYFDENEKNYIPWVSGFVNSHYALKLWKKTNSPGNSRKFLIIPINNDGKKNDNRIIFIEENYGTMSYSNGDAEYIKSMLKIA